MLKHKSYVIDKKRLCILKLFFTIFVNLALCMLLFSRSTSEIMCQFFYFSLHHLPLISHLGVMVSLRELREHIQDSMASSKIVIQRDLSYLAHLPLL